MIGGQGTRLLLHVEELALRRIMRWRRRLNDARVVVVVIYSRLIDCCRRRQRFASSASVMCRHRTAHIKKESIMYVRPCLTIAGRFSTIFAVCRVVPVGESFGYFPAISLLVEKRPAFLAGNSGRFCDPKTSRNFPGRFQTTWCFY